MAKRKFMAFLLIAVTLIVCIAFAGCGKNKYNVDYHGQEELFKGAKASYAEGTEVKLTYDLIGTDTDYSFYVVGAEDYDVDYEDGYVITFTMPGNDVEVYCESRNSMVYVPEPINNLQLADIYCEIPEGTAGMKPISFENDILEYAVVNNTDEIVSFGTSFDLQKKEGDDYVIVEPLEELMWTMMLCEVQPGTEENFTANLGFFGILEPGDYRLVKTEDLYMDFRLKE